LESQQEDTGAAELQNSCFIPAQLEMMTQNECTRQVSGLGSSRGFFFLNVTQNNTFNGRFLQTLHGKEIGFAF